MHTGCGLPRDPASSPRGCGPQRVAGRVVILFPFYLLRRQHTAFRGSCTVSRSLAPGSHPDGRGWDPNAQPCAHWLLTGLLQKNPDSSPSPVSASDAWFCWWALLLCVLGTNLRSVYGFLPLPTVTGKPASDPIDAAARPYAQAERGSLGTSGLSGHYQGARVPGAPLWSPQPHRQEHPVSHSASHQNLLL